MGRKCSHCGKMGHNSRTCSSRRRHVWGGRFRLFGVELDCLSSQSSSPPSSPSSVAMLKKSFSMECLDIHQSNISSASNSSSAAAPSSTSPINSSTSTVHDDTSDKVSDVYLSDGLLARAQERKKKGAPWTEEEHKIFLIGLEKLGKGDWRGISRKFVTTRTPTQVASHAQKYFLRHNTLINKRNRRPSLFDVADHQLSQWGISVPKKTPTLPTSLVKLDLKYSSRSSTGKTGHIYDHDQWKISHHHNPQNCRLTVQSFNHESLRISQLETPSYSTTKSASLGSSDSVVAPELELKLAAPTQLDQQQSKPCRRDLLSGPITVTL